MPADPVTAQQLRAALLGWFPDAFPQTIDPREIDWAALIDLAARTKTLFLMREGLSRLGISPPADHDEHIRKRRAICLAQNMANIAGAARLSAILRTHGIEALVFKGVLRSRDVYGHYDIRPAHDLDLLVSSADYRSAISVLENNGYTAAISENSRWWHDYLGESPHLPCERGGIIVDLHHRLQQPGTPAPKALARLFARARTVEMGNRRIATLDREDAALIVATGFGKAMRNDEPWLVYAHELAFVWQQLCADERARYAANARRQGVGRLWEDAIATANGLFGGGEPSEQVSGQDKLRGLLMSATGLEDDDKPRFHRSKLLWTWTDGGPARPFRVAAHMAQVRRSERSHDKEERAGTMLRKSEPLQAA